MQRKMLATLLDGAALAAVRLPISNPCLEGFGDCLADLVGRVDAVLDLVAHRHRGFVGFLFCGESFEAPSALLIEIVQHPRRALHVASRPRPLSDAGHCSLRLSLSLSMVPMLTCHQIHCNTIFDI